MSTGVSDKTRLITLLLAGLLGVFGAHRFYAGRSRSGVLMALTLGGLGIWALYDFIIIAGGGFRDGDDRLILDREPSERDHSEQSPDVMYEPDQLREEVAELTERMDFTERLLSNQRRDELDRPRTGRGPSDAQSVEENPK